MAICRTVCACATVSQSPYFLGGLCLHGWMMFRGYFLSSYARWASLSKKGRVLARIGIPTW
ncbi:hypothetical protein CGRA01v4_07779 [Colletotrichum graminicola]|nr:hypothetical protein CGRA01v4_07779 [Colletotrichum graminicola]